MCVCVCVFTGIRLRRRSQQVTSKVLSGLPTSHLVLILISAYWASVPVWQLCQSNVTVNYALLNYEFFNLIFFIVPTTAHLKQDSHIQGKISKCICSQCCSPPGTPFCALFCAKDKYKQNSKLSF